MKIFPNIKPLYVTLTLLISLHTAGGFLLPLFASDTDCSSPCCSKSVNSCCMEDVNDAAAEPEPGECTCRVMPQSVDGLPAAATPPTIQVFSGLGVVISPLTSLSLNEDTPLCAVVSSPPLPSLSRHIASTVLRI